LAVLWQGEVRETFLRKSPQHPAHLDLLTPHLNLIHRAVMFHGGDKRVPAGAPAELDHGLPKESTVRVPHVTADIFGARPTDLNIVDGIRTIRGGEGHWNEGIGLMNPKVLVVGRNGVCTDSVCTAVMGFDPQAPDGQGPFQGTNHLQLLASAGVGANDLRRIEVRGLSIKEAVCPFQVPRAESKQKA